MLCYVICSRIYTFIILKICSKIEIEIFIFYYLSIGSKAFFTENNAVSDAIEFLLATGISQQDVMSKAFF